MPLFDDILALDSVAEHDPDFAPGNETLVYTKVGGTTRTVYGNVDRAPAVEMDLGNGKIFVPSMTISFPNSTTGGIVPTEVNEGGDTITVDYPKGATALPHPIFGKPISQDAGACLWAVGSKG